MIRTGQDYRDKIRDGRAVYLAGARLADPARDARLGPAIDLRAAIFDLAHDPAAQPVMTIRHKGRLDPVANALPFSQADWWAKRRAFDRVADLTGGMAPRWGDDTLGEMWSLHDATDALHAIDPQFTGNIRAHVARAVHDDPFHISANADPGGDRSRPTAIQDPDLRLHVVRETDAGLVLRGAKFETGAAIAEQSFVKPAIAEWGGAEFSPHAVGFICDHGAPGLKFICRPGPQGPHSALPAGGETLMIFDDVLIPWENVLFHRHVQAARQIRATLHRYSAFGFVNRLLRLADLMIGTALACLRQTGLDPLQAVQDKLARLALWREGIHAHLTAAITLAERSPGGLMMPNQSLLYAGRVLACDGLAPMTQLARELCGGQPWLVPDGAAFADPETGPWLQRLYQTTPDTLAEDRRRLLAYAHDLLDGAGPGQGQAFFTFSQGAPHAQLAAIYHNFDWEGPLALLRRAAGLTDGAAASPPPQPAKVGLAPWFTTRVPQTHPKPEHAG